MGSGPRTTVASVTARVISAVAEHLAAIAAIERACFSDPWSEDAFRTLLDSEYAIVLVAADDAGAVLGYSAAIRALDEGEILNVAVAAGARRHGIGGLLLDSALDSLRASDVRKVYLEVRESNEPAKTLYRSRGFSPLSIRREYYRRPVESALILRLDLAAGE